MDRQTEREREREREREVWVMGVATCFDERGVVLTTAHSIVFNNLLSLINDIGTVNLRNMQRGI